MSTNTSHKDIAQNTGVLYLVASPIGNLEDISFRAIETLKKVDLVLAEDTRKFSNLAQRFAIATPARSYHDHNERERTEEMIEKLKSAQNIALIPEAGTPTISDPGYRLVRRCRDEGIEIQAIPGACAAITALSISGFEPDQFHFAGFLPRKDGKRKESFSAAIERGITTIFYESPHRIIKSLKALQEISPDAEVFIGRELTKMHEESLFGSVAEVIETLEKRASVKGEIVLLVRRQ